MDVYKCKLCNNIYKSSSSRSNHIKRVHKKNDNHNDNHPIIIDDNHDNHNNHNKEKKYNCKNCGKIFDFYQNRWRHEKKCNIKNKKENLKQTIENTNINSTTINNGTINNTVNDNKKIVINNYGNNNLEYLSDKFIKNLMKHFLLGEEFQEPIPKLIENINFNPNHKENNNVKITNIRSKIGYKYTDNKWIAVDKEKLLKDLYKMGNEILEKIVDEMKHIPANIKDGYENFQGTKESLEKFIKKEIEIIGYLYFKNNELDE